MNVTSYFDLTQQKPWDAAHLAVQSATAAVAVFVAMQALGMPEKFVGVLSAVLVIQPSVGNTIVEAGDRVVATIVGSIVGVICLFLLPYGYGTAIALAVTMLVINAAAGFRPDWRYGVVAGVALALGSEQNAMQTAQERSLAIALGAFIGVAVSVVVWPDTASKRANRHINSALFAAAEMLDRLIGHAAGNAEPDDVQGIRQRFGAALSSARQAADGIRFADSRAVEDRIEQTQRLHQSLTTIERVSQARRQAGIEDNAELSEAIETVRKEACEAVLSLAREGRLDEGELDNVIEAVERAKDTPRNSERIASMLDNALVFALGEVTLSLRNLKRAFEEDYEGSMLDWGSDAQDAIHDRLGRIKP